MSDFDDIISGAVTGRADGAPTAAPDFEMVLAARQDRMRRRSAMAAGGLVVAALAGIGLFATAADDAPHVAGEPTTTPPLLDSRLEAPLVPETGQVWYCTGRLVDPFGDAPQTTALGTAPTTTTLSATTLPASTTTLPPDENADLTTQTTLSPQEESGYFEHCTLLGADGFPMVSTGPTVPTTTTIPAEGGEISEGTSPPVTTIGVDSDQERIDAEARAAAEAAEVEARRLAEEGITTPPPPTTAGG